MSVSAGDWETSSFDYETFSENLKLMSIYMPHYSDKKSFMVSAIKRIVRDMQIEAQNEAQSSIKCSTEKCSEAEISAQRLKFRLTQNYNAIHPNLVKKSFILLNSSSPVVETTSKMVKYEVTSELAFFEKYLTHKQRFLVTLNQFSNDFCIVPLVFFSF